ncbi:endopeptidase La [Patescibacteria group bacterium]|nr:endopeptidase La [Patescibacteria group bacterium]MBU1915966.1 endopeptidase La [Patescibacteria group bacterium]
MQTKDNQRFIQEYFGKKNTREAPLIPLRDTVVFPRVALPIVVRRSRSMKALEEAMNHDRVIVLSAQRDPETEDPEVNQVYDICSLAKVRELVKQDEGTVRVLVEGLVRVRIKSTVAQSPYLKVVIEPHIEPVSKKNEHVEALMYSVLNQFRRVINMGANVSFDALLVILNMSEPWLLSDLIAANVEINVNEKQRILEATKIEEKLGLVARALGRQIKIMQIASKIQAETGKELDKMQRELFLREQLKSIEKELENMNAKSDNDDLPGRIEAADLPEMIKSKALKEYQRLKAMPSFSPETSYVRTYLEWLCDLPWNKKDETKINLRQAQKILNEDHYGLNKPKERVLEYLAVQKLVGKMRGSIMCFAGPPGTGKTSLGKSIARSLGRKFLRVSLGGVHDEAEIRGHRRTYVGALPGRIIQGIATAGTKNPVFMLDEIDKIGADFRGDPSAALLEALDPEQNSEFSDHYLEVPFDLSDVLFITTANMLDTIPPALRDRMEIIEFPGYTEREKLEIAKGYLVPKTFKNCGLERRGYRFSDSALTEILRYYTREAGVRNLEREISAICRKLAKKTVEGTRPQKVIKPAGVEKYLGPRKYSHLQASKKNDVGVVTGLAWTEAGGEILQIEATRMPGKGNLILTGQLGEVMQESARAALSYVRSVASQLGFDINFFQDADFHIHVPAGAIPKDGPSAGAAMAVALVSLLGDVVVDRTVGLTGEITLRGHILEIGGIKEKCLAAHRAGLKRIIMPTDNRRDLPDVPAEVRNSMEFVFVKNMDEVLSLLLKKTGPGRRMVKSRQSKKQK